MSPPGDPAHKILHDHIQRPYSSVTYDEDWRNLPEIPDEDEIMPADPAPSVQTDAWNSYQMESFPDNELPTNIIDGPWPDKSSYIGAHYQILREDGTNALKKAIRRFKEDPAMIDDKEVAIYVNIHIIGLQLSNQGVGFRISFSAERAMKRIRWEQSKRLQQGSLVVLSPASDMFHKKCKIAIVASSTKEGLKQNPPQIELFWADQKYVACDPAEKARGAYFEAYRHTLVAMQKLPLERFQLSKYLVDLDTSIEAPEYLRQQPLKDLSSLVEGGPAPVPLLLTGLGEDPEYTKAESVENLNVLEGTFVKATRTKMNPSQMAACESMITKQLAIIQGPPGTGKTFTSVASLKVLIKNLGAGDAPIIVAAQTNHALDQILNKVIEFAPEGIVRLGGRSDRENKQIAKRTLYELRQSTKEGPKWNSGLTQGYRALGLLQESIKETSSPLASRETLTEEALIKAGLITQVQADSLRDGTNAESNPAEASTMMAWLGDQLAEIKVTNMINMGFDEEEPADSEHAEEQDMELESSGGLDDNRDALSGEPVVFRRKYSGRAGNLTGPQIKTLLQKSNDLYDIPPGSRGQVYQYMESKVNKTMLDKLKQQLVEYDRLLRKLKIAKWDLNVDLIKFLNIKIIGCTTTGLSKYRGLLSALEPKILLIEEAAETLEATVIAGMLDSLEHLILVGDHKQLQAHCNIRHLAEEPYNLEVSMFERLVNNGMGFVMLDVQHRMIPEIRELVCVGSKPFYSSLFDDPSVRDPVNRPPVPGMGSKSIYWFDHSWPEKTNSDLSKYNELEAAMIGGHANYLVEKGVECEKITILTYYNGQRKEILTALRKFEKLKRCRFKVYTVDSYQGEENDVILLSLVRSNEVGNIGFLANANRMVVALTRARCGLYIFGNSVTMTLHEQKGEMDNGRPALWIELLLHLRQQYSFSLDKPGLPITCSHKNTVHICSPDDWLRLPGCLETCGFVLSCGHVCSTLCGQPCICADQCTSSAVIGEDPKDLAEWEEAPGQAIVKQAPLVLLGSSRTPSALEPTSPELSNENPKPSRTVTRGWGLSFVSETPTTWKKFDAVENDAAQAEAAALEETEHLKQKRSGKQYKEKFVQAEIKNGVRANLKSVEREISRFDGPDDDDDYGAANVPETGGPNGNHAYDSPKETARNGDIANGGTRNQANGFPSATRNRAPSQGAFEVRDEQDVPAAESLPSPSSTALASHLRHGPISSSANVSDYRANSNLNERGPNGTMSEAQRRTFGGPNLANRFPGRSHRRNYAVQIPLSEIPDRQNWLQSEGNSSATNGHRAASQESTPGQISLDRSSAAVNGLENGSSNDENEN